MSHRRRRVHRTRRCRTDDRVAHAALACTAGAHPWPAPRPAGFVLTGTTPCEKSGPPASDGSIKDADGHNHRGPIDADPDRPGHAGAAAAAAGQAAAVAVQYPTVAAAEAAGYAQSTPFVPCIGAHYTNIGLVPGFDPSKPSELLFDGTKPDSQIIGLSYLVLHPGGAPDGLRRAERPLASAQRQRRPLLLEGRRHRDRGRAAQPGAVRGDQWREAGAARHLDAARLGRPRLGVLLGRVRTRVPRARRQARHATALTG